MKDIVGYGQNVKPATFICDLHCFDGHSAHTAEITKKPILFENNLTKITVSDVEPVVPYFLPVVVFCKQTENKLVPDFTRDSFI